MLEDILTKKEAIQIMHERDKYNEKKPFSIVFFKADTTKNKAGEAVEIQKAVVCGLPNKMKAKENELIGVRDTLSSSHDYTVHMALIYSINGQRVSQ